MDIIDNYQKVIIFDMAKNLFKLSLIHLLKNYFSRMNHKKVSKFFKKREPFLKHLRSFFTLQMINYCGHGRRFTDTYYQEKITRITVEVDNFVSFLRRYIVF